ncbi:MAG: DNA internalization-related competence protein ComEC/Rec2 [Slackia sp.]|nr:DNA internalization-related competence protein ComEC/Rec2 [Slackia sp.]
MGMLDEGLADAGLAIDGSHPLRPLPPLVFVCALVAWLFAVAVFFATYVPCRPLPDGLDPGIWTFEAIEDARQGEFGYSVAAHAFKEGRRYDVRVLYNEGKRFMAHERFEAYATFESFSEQSSLRLSQQGLIADAYVKQEPVSVPCGPLGPLIELRSWASGLFDGVQTRGAALMRALLVGDRVDLDYDGFYDDMKTIGLAHMVAVSGSHLSVVAAMAGFAMKALGFRRKTCAVILCVFYAAYAVFTGLSAPVIRAAVMSSVVVSSIWARRRSSALAALSACICLLIALNPYNALSLSFFLSAASTFGVIVFAPLFSSWAIRMTGGRFEKACEAFALTVAASLPMAPVTVVVFSRLSLIAPLANFIAAPVFGFLLAAGLLVLFVATFALPLGAAGIVVLSAAAEAFCIVSSWAAGMPYAAVPLTGNVLVCTATTVLVIAVLWIWWPRFRASTLWIACAASLCVGAIAACVVPRFAGDEIVMLDVGQGDAILVRSQGESMLIDTGNQEQKLLSALARCGMSSVDWVAISHHDDDHCGCLELLAPNIAGGVLLCDGVFMCACDDCGDLLATAKNAAGEERVAGIKAGDSLQVGRFACTAVWPYAFEEEGGNPDSLCFLIEYDAQGDGSPESSALMTGDAEAEQIRAMLDEAGLSSVDVLKAGHHGSKAGVDDGFSERVGAGAVLISVGEGNRYGHPSNEAIDEFRSGGMEIFRTDEHGDVTCRFVGEEIIFTTQKG